MDASSSVIVFVKAPVPHTVKTRLVPALAFDQAAALAEAFAQDTVQWVNRVCQRTDGGKPQDNRRVWIAYQPHPHRPTPAWVGGTVPWFSQEGEHLGQRLTHAFNRVFQIRRGPVIALGADSPTLPVSRLDDAFMLIREQEVVLGPSEDGGYYLIGLQRSEPALFEGIPWSTPLVFQTTCARAVEQSLSLARLPTWFDVDTPEDLARLADTLRSPDVSAQAPHTASVLAAWGLIPQPKQQANVA